MQRFKILGVGLLAVCALSLVALPMSAAWAKKAKPVLQLNEGETAAGAEAPALLAVDMTGCFPSSVGHLTGNDAATVKYVPTESEDGCGREGTSMTGGFTEVSMTDKGALTLTGSVTIAEEVEAEHCSYTYKKFKLKLAIPGPVKYNGTASGKLDKAGSGKKCPKTGTTGLVVDLYALLGDFEPFTAVLT